MYTPGYKVLHVDRTHIITVIGCEVFFPYSFHNTEGANTELSRRCSNSFRYNRILAYQYQIVEMVINSRKLDSPHFAM